jgi:hypothetical protein
MESPGRWTGPRYAKRILFSRPRSGCPPQRHSTPGRLATLIRRNEGFARCVFLPYRNRGNVPAGVRVHDVSRYADFPFCQLSPLYVHGGILVPGIPGTVSDIVGLELTE